MYNNKFIVAVKHKGKIMREIGGAVYLPFGSDYSILLKNQNITRAVTDIKIDGVDVLDGSSVIVASNDTLDLEGFMSGNVVHNKFRFIEKTKKIYDYRGSRIDDGTIRVEFKFERVNIEPIFYGPKFDPWRPVGPTNSHFPIKYCSSKFTSSCVDCCLNDNGITVKGEQTNQDFVTADIGRLEEMPSVISILLKGRDEETNKFVKKPLTVKTDIKCHVCGTKSKSYSKFCRECGTFLR